MPSHAVYPDPSVVGSLSPTRRDDSIVPRGHFLRPGEYETEVNRSSDGSIGLMVEPNARDEPVVRF